MTDNMSQISTTDPAQKGPRSGTWRTGPRRSTRIGRGAVAAASATALALALTSCASDGEGPASVPTRDPATPVASPSTSSPAGAVIATADSITTVAVDEQSRTLLVQTSGPDRLDVFAIADNPPTEWAEQLRSFDLPAGAMPASFPGDGTALIPSPEGLTVLTLADGQTRTAETDGAALSAVKAADGRYGVGTDQGAVEVLNADLTPERKVTGFASVDGLVASGDFVVALDTRQTSVTEINMADGKASGALRAGVGTTQIIADHYGRVLAADSDASQIVVFGVDPILNRQAGPVGEPAGKSPYGLADDIARNVVWVTLTGSNEVVGLDLSSGAPEERFRLATVQDPRSVTVDEQTGDLYIGSSSGGGLQRISAADIK